MALPADPVLLDPTALTGPSDIFFRLPVHVPEDLSLSTPAGQDVDGAGSERGFVTRLREGLDTPVVDLGTLLGLDLTVTPQDVVGLFPLAAVPEGLLIFESGLTPLERAAQAGNTVLSMGGSSPSSRRSAGRRSKRSPIV